MDLSCTPSSVLHSFSKQPLLVVAVGKSQNLWPYPMDLGTLSTLEQSGDPNTGAFCPSLPLWEGNSCLRKGPTPAGV